MNPVQVVIACTVALAMTGFPADAAVAGQRGMAMKNIEYLNRTNHSTGTVTTCGITTCPIGKQVKPCQHNQTMDSCEPCPAGTHMLDSTTSSNVVLECVEVHECSYYDPHAIKSTEYNDCLGGVHTLCKCDIENNWCGEPCSCHRPIDSCGQGQIRLHNCTCVQDPDQVPRTPVPSKELTSTTPPKELTTTPDLTKAQTENPTKAPGTSVKSNTADGGSSSLPTNVQNRKSSPDNEDKISWKTVGATCGLLLATIVGFLVPIVIYKKRTALTKKIGQIREQSNITVCCRREYTSPSDQNLENGDAKTPKPKKEDSLESLPEGTDTSFPKEFNPDKVTTDGRKATLKITSWNVNGLRAWMKGDGQSYLKTHDPDILCIQETKCSLTKLPKESEVEGYHAYWSAADTEGYAGTGMYTKTKPISLTYGIGIDKHDKEGRVITAEFDKFFLVTSYVPNSGKGLVRLDYRTKEWDIDFRTYLKKLDAKKPLILCGDLNVAHTPADLKNPKTNKKTPGFTEAEREEFTTLLGEGFVDSFRGLYPNAPDCFSYWTYTMNARSKNVGWRLDYFVLSERLKKDLCDSIIQQSIMGSDHCPIMLSMALDL